MSAIHSTLQLICHIMQNVHRLFLIVELCTFSYILIRSKHLITRLCLKSAYHIKQEKKKIFKFSVFFLNFPDGAATFLSTMLDLVLVNGGVECKALSDSGVTVQVGGLQQLVT